MVVMVLRLSVFFMAVPKVVVPGHDSMNECRSLLSSKRVSSFMAQCSLSLLISLEFHAKSLFHQSLSR